MGGFPLYAKAFYIVVFRCFARLFEQNSAESNQLQPACDAARQHIGSEGEKERVLA